MVAHALLVLALLAAGDTAAVQQAEPAGAKEIFQARKGQILSLRAAPAESSVPAASEAPTGPPPTPASPPPARRPDRRTGRPAPTPEPVKAKPQTVGGPVTADGLSWWVEVIGEGGEGRVVVPSRTFRSGETIRLRFESNRDGFLELFLVAPDGSLRALFPDPGKGLHDNRLQAFHSRVLPDEDFWFRFDDQPGLERLLAVFSPDAEDLKAMPRAAENLFRLAADRQGSKGLLVEVATGSGGDPRVYSVSLDGGPVIQEIVLRHE